MRIIKEIIERGWWVRALIMDRLGAQTNYKLLHKDPQTDRDLKSLLSSFFDCCLSVVIIDSLFVSWNRDL